MGSVFRVPFLITDRFSDYIKELTDHGFNTMASVVDKNAQKITDVDKGNATVIVIGNEANGVLDQTAESCKLRVTIPMKGNSESLNAATAAGILTWELSK